MPQASPFNKPPASAHQHNGRSGRRSIKQCNCPVSRHAREHWQIQGVYCKHTPRPKQRSRPENPNTIPVRPWRNYASSWSEGDAVRSYPANQDALRQWIESVPASTGAALKLRDDERSIGGAIASGALRKTRAKLLARKRNEKRSTGGPAVSGAVAKTAGVSVARNGSRPTGVESASDVFGRTRCQIPEVVKNVVEESLASRMIAEWDRDQMEADIDKAMSADSGIDIEFNLNRFDEPMRWLQTPPVVIRDSIGPPAIPCLPQHLQAQPASFGSSPGRSRTIQTPQLSTATEAEAARLATPYNEFESTKPKEAHCVPEQSLLKLRNESQYLLPYRRRKEQRSFPEVQIRAYVKEEDDEQDREQEKLNLGSSDVLLRSIEGIDYYRDVFSAGYSERPSDISNYEYDELSCRGDHDSDSGSVSEENSGEEEISDSETRIEIKSPRVVVGEVVETPKSDTGAHLSVRLRWDPYKERDWSEVQRQIDREYEEIFGKDTEDEGSSGANECTKTKVAGGVVGDVSEVLDLSVDPRSNASLGMGVEVKRIISDTEVDSDDDHKAVFGMCFESDESSDGEKDTQSRIARRVVDDVGDALATHTVLRSGADLKVDAGKKRNSSETTSDSAEDDDSAFDTDSEIVESSDSEDDTESWSDEESMDEAINAQEKKGAFRSDVELGLGVKRKRTSNEDVLDSDNDRGLVSQEESVNDESTDSEDCTGSRSAAEAIGDVVELMDLSRSGRSDVMLSVKRPRTCLDTVNDPKYKLKRTCLDTILYPRSVPVAPVLPDVNAMEAVDPIEDVESVVEDCETWSSVGPVEDVDVKEGTILNPICLDEVDGREEEHGDTDEEEEEEEEEDDDDDDERDMDIQMRSFRAESVGCPRRLAETLASLRWKMEFAIWQRA